MVKYFVNKQIHNISIDREVNYSKVFINKFMYVFRFTLDT